MRVAPWLLLFSVLGLGCGLFERPIFSNNKGACVGITDVPPGVTGAQVKMPNIPEFPAKLQEGGEWVFCIDEEKAEKTNFTSIFAARIIMLTGQVFITFEEGTHETTFVNQQQFPVYKNRTRETTYEEWTGVENEGYSGPGISNNDNVPWALHVEKKKGSAP